MNTLLWRQDKHLAMETMIFFTDIAFHWKNALLISIRFGGHYNKLSALNHKLYFSFDEDNDI